MIVLHAYTHRGTSVYTESHQKPWTFTPFNINPVACCCLSVLQYLQTLHRLLVLLGVNVPLLATRMLLWQHVQLPVSTFLVKNVAVSFLILYSFYERDHHRRLRDRLAERQEMVS